MDLITLQESLPVQYSNMLEKIQTNMPAILEETKSFYKSQSQYMNNMLTVTALTPIRNIRQILAEINKSKMAIDEAYLKNKKRKLQIKQKEAKIDRTDDLLEKEIIQVDIQIIERNILSSENYMLGAIRKIAAYITQRDSILQSIGKDTITEEEYEQEEIKYHIGTAFSQALIAARSRNGVIDEGNHIYFHQIGINGAAAQAHISNYLGQENDLLKENKAPTHDMTLLWLNSLMYQYKDCSEHYAKIKGMSLLNNESLISNCKE